MSDPVSNAEIEDVLSSIRRLVSENAAPEPRPVAREPIPPAQDNTPAQDKSDKLVLTPAFRVHDVTERSDLHQHDAEVAPEGPAAIVEGVSEHDGQAGPVAETLHLTEALSISQDEVMGAGEALADEGETPSEITSVSHDDLHEAFQEDPESPPESDIQDVPEDNSFDASQAATDVAADEPMRPLDDAQEPGELADDFEAEHDIQSSSEDVSDAPSADQERALDHRVAELEAAVNDSAVEFEPDLGDAVEDLGPGIFLRRRAEAEAGPEAVEDRQGEPAEVKSPDPNWEAFDAEVDAFVTGADQIEGEAHAIDAPIGDQDDAILSVEDEVDLLDEDMLRELVTRLVREELQGAVGEKITRNVRRLVRREVQRALTLKSLE